MPKNLTNVPADLMDPLAVFQYVSDTLEELRGILQPGFENAKEKKEVVPCQLVAMVYCPVKNTNPDGASVQVCTKTGRSVMIASMLRD